MLVVAVALAMQGNFTSSATMNSNFPLQPLGENAPSQKTKREGKRDLALPSVALGELSVQRALPFLVTDSR